MAEIIYSLLVTGDCTSTGSGAIEISFTGGTPPYYVEWQSPNLGSDYSVLTSTRTNLLYGDYLVSVTDSSIPTSIQFNVTIPVSNYNCCSIDSVQSTSCNLDNGTVTVSSTPNSTLTNFYLYTTNDDLVQTVQETIPQTTFIGLSAGTYYVISDNVGGCSGQSETFIVTQSSELDFGLYVVPNASCGLGPIGKIYITGLTGTGPYTYNWSNGATSDVATGLTEGFYTLTVTDSFGCSKTMSALVDTVGLLDVVFTQVTPPSCLTNDGVLNIILTGGTLPFYYSASTGYVEVSYSRNFSLSGVGAGNYTINVTDAAFCQTTTSLLLSSPSGMTSVSVSVLNSNCFLNDGALSVNIIGGNIPYTYTLVYPDTNSITILDTNPNHFFSSLSGGTYTLSIQDASGCTFINNFTISNIDKYSAYTEVTGTTYGQSNGKITVFLTSGGTAPYNFTLDDYQSIIQTQSTAVTFNNLSKGTHKLTVSDFENCVQTYYVDIEEQPFVDFFLYPTDAGIINDGTLTAFISSGTPPFSFVWSDNVSGNPQSIYATGLSGGTYSLTIIDGNGSSLQRTSKINQKQIIVSYEEFVMGDEVFQPITNSKYSLSKMLNEGFEDLTKENNGCELQEADFYTKVYVEPFNQEISEKFFETKSLIVYPSDNLWYDSMKGLLMSVQGVGDVIINEVDNQIKIIADKNNLPIIDGEITKINIKVYLIIEYSIKCKS